MKLSVSAIAWDAKDEDEAFSLLSGANVRKVELVPARIPDVEKCRAALNAKHLEACAFQALLFGTQGLHLFEDAENRTRLMLHLKSLCNKARAVGAHALVFGSPRNRWIDHSCLSSVTAIELARNFFVELGAHAASNATAICLEPNPEAYGCNFLTTTEQTAAFVRSVNSPGIRLNLDTGAMQMNGEAPHNCFEAVKDVIGHVHISDPNLMIAGENRAWHEEFADILKKTNYPGVVSLEMLCSKGTCEWRESLQSGIKFMTEIYG